MQFYNYLSELEEMKKLESTMIGFKVPFNEIQKTSESIRSLLDKYAIDYKYNQTPHITIAQITGKYRKDKLTQIIQKTKTKLGFKFKQLNLFDGKYTGRSYVVVELKNNQDYRNIVSWFNEQFPEFRGFPGGMKPHISIVNTKLGAITPEVWEEIVNNVPVPKNIGTKGIDLYTSKFEVGYSFKGKK